MTDANRHSRAAATGHVRPDTLLLVLRGLADLDTAHGVYGHIRDCETCAKRARDLYQQRIARQGLASRLAPRLSGWVSDVPRSRVAYAVAVGLLVLAVAVPVVSGGGFLTRQDLERRPFAASIVGEAQNAVVRAYTATGSVDLAPEPNRFETPGMKHYPSPPWPSDAVVLPSEQDRHCDVLIGSSSPFRPRGRLHLVRWSQRTNRFSFLVPADVADFVPGAILDGQQIAVRQVAVAQSKRPEDLPRALVWWQSRGGSLAGLCVFAYDAGSDREPLRHAATLVNWGWPSPVGDELPGITGVMRATGADRDSLALFWVLHDSSLGPGIVPMSGNGAGLAVSLVDPFELRGMAATPFFALRPGVPDEWPVECGLGSWIVPRLLPYPDYGNTTLYHSLQVEFEGTVDVYQSAQRYRVDARTRTCTGLGPIDYFETSAGEELDRAAEEHTPRQVHRVDPGRSERAALDAERQRLAELVRRDVALWTDIYRHLDRSKIPAQYRSFLDELYGKPATENEGLFNRIRTGLKPR